MVESSIIVCGCYEVLNLIETEFSDLSFLFPFSTNTRKNKLTRSLLLCLVVGSTVLLIRPHYIFLPSYRF